VELRNRLVHFRVRDVYVPAPHDVLDTLYGDHLLQGRVVDVTPGDEREPRFAVVTVDDLAQSLIVPVSRILGAL